jgi:hypothetical protein
VTVHRVATVAGSVCSFGHHIFSHIFGRGRAHSFFLTEIGAQDRLEWLLIGPALCTANYFLHFLIVVCLINYFIQNIY